MLKLYSDYSLSVYGEGWVNQITNKYLNHPNYQELFSNNWILKKECKTSKKGNYLEIGPGGGEILKCFESLGWNCYGVEPGRWVNGNPKILHNFSKLPTNILYDVIVAEDVIEHVTNPLKMISELSKKLSATTIGLLGKKGSIKKIVDIPLSVQCKTTPEIQEAHRIIYHIICEHVEKILMKNKK